MDDFLRRRSVPDHVRADSGFYTHAIDVAFLSANPRLRNLSGRILDDGAAIATSPMLLATTD